MKIKPCRRETAKKVVEILHNSLCDGLSSSKLLNVLLEEETFRRNSCVCACVSVRERERERERKREGGREGEWEGRDRDTLTTKAMFKSLQRTPPLLMPTQAPADVTLSNWTVPSIFSLSLQSANNVGSPCVGGGTHTHGKQTNFNEFIAVCACDVCTTNEREWLLQLEIS